MVTLTVNVNVQGGRTKSSFRRKKLARGDQVIFNNRSTTSRLTVSIADKNGGISPLGQGGQPMSQVPVPASGSITLDVLRTIAFTFSAHIAGSLPEGPIIIIER